MVRSTSTQRGYATLAVALILLVAITLITLYGARTSVMKQRILGNEIRATASFIEAERGLDEGTMFLSRNLDAIAGAWVTAPNNRWAACTAADTALPCGNGSTNVFGAGFVRYVDPDNGGAPSINELSSGGRSVRLVAACVDADGTAGCDDLDASAAGTQPGPDRRALVHVIAGGTSDDATGSAAVRQSLYVYPLISAPPASPLTVRAGANVSGSFQIVTNPNGGGTGVPVSIWSNQPVDVSTNAVVTCELGEYELNGGSCPGNAQQSLTVDGAAGIDIIDEAANFPTDMFAYVFGVDASEYQQVKDRAASAGHLLTDCTSLGTASQGLYWIDGGCDLKSEIGSLSGPVLIVATGAVDINAGAEIYGLVFAFDAYGTAGSIKLNGNAFIRGGFVADRAPSHTNGSLTIYYDGALLEGLAADGSLAAVGRVPGSWADYHE